jgi:hypothetical protein
MMEVSSDLLKMLADHDLLIKISVQIEGVNNTLNTDRAAWTLVTAKQSAELAEMRKEQAADKKVLQDQITSLDRSRAKMLGMTATMSAALIAIEHWFLPK